MTEWLKEISHDLHHQVAIGGWLSATVFLYIIGPKVIRVLNLAIEVLGIAKKKLSKIR